MCILNPAVYISLFLTLDSLPGGGAPPAPPTPDIRSQPPFAASIAPWMKKERSIKIWQVQQLIYCHLLPMIGWLVRNKQPWSLALMKSKSMNRFWFSVLRFFSWPKISHAVLVASSMTLMSSPGRKQLTCATAQNAARTTKKRICANQKQHMKNERW